MNDNNSPLAEEATAYYTELLRPVFADRKWLIAGPVAVGLGGLARRLTALGADRPFLIAGTEGTGATPTPEEAELHVLGLAGKDILEAHRNLHTTLHDLPPALRRAIDAWDPTESANFIFASPLAESSGAPPRRPYGARPASWAALEDKVKIDAFWDATGVKRAPSKVVPARYESLKTAAATLDRGLGTVWAADGDGRGAWLRWVRRGADSTLLRSFAADRRPSPRHAVSGGYSASITHPCFGHVAVSDPWRWSYCGRLRDRCSTRAAPRHSIRVRRPQTSAMSPTTGTSSGNRRHRGPFGIDGILAEEATCRPDEPRAGAALGPWLRSPHLPLAPLCLGHQARNSTTDRTSWDERSSSPRTRVAPAAGWSVTANTFDEAASSYVVRMREYRESSGEEPRDHSVRSKRVGGFLRFTSKQAQIQRIAAAPECSSPASQPGVEHDIANSRRQNLDRRP